MNIAANKNSDPGRNVKRAFTLIEVVIATALFFMAMFAILDLVMRNVRAAHSLQKAGPTAGMVAAQLSLTNKLEEGSYAEDFEEYPGYSWTADSQIYATNGMFLVNITVLNGNAEYDKLSVLFYRPDSSASSTGARMMFSDGPRGASSGLSTRNSSGSQGNNFQNGGSRGGGNNRGNFNGRQR